MASTATLPAGATLVAKAMSFARLNLPQRLEHKGIRNYYAIIDISTLFDLKDWREINVRDPRGTGRVPDKINNCMKNSDLFPIINRGLLLHANQVRWDNKTNVIELDVDEAELHGLADGGHTYYQIAKMNAEVGEDRLISPQYVKVEILSGLDKKSIVDVVDGRNSSTQVKDESLEDARDTFQGIKDAIQDRNYANLISYSEYEVYTDPDGKETRKPVSVYDVMKCLICLDADSFNDQKHPDHVVTRDGKTLLHFKNNLDKMRPIYPLLHDALRLWDTIGMAFVDCYKKAGGQASRIGTGDQRFFRKMKKGSEKLYFIDGTNEWIFADSLRFPALAAFRSAVIKGKKEYRWNVPDPCVFFTEVVGPKITKVICSNLLDTQDPVRTIRTEAIWQSCYDAVENAILKQSK